MMRAQRYVVFAGFDEPVGILVYGGQHYYSDEPPWLTPTDLAHAVYKKADPRSKYRLVPEGDVCDEVWEIAHSNQWSQKYRKVVV